MPFTLRPQLEPSKRETWVSSTLSGREAVSTAKPWFMEVISTLPVVWSMTGWFAPWWPWCIFTVRPPTASPIIWWPRQIPKVGMPLSITARIVGTAYSPVAAGSPGPLERKTPSGWWASTSSAVAVAGSTVTLQPWSARRRRMLRFTPKSMATTWYFGASCRPKPRPHSQVVSSQP